MKRLILPVAAIILLTGLSLWSIPWLENGGWPSSGPVGSTFPVNILKVIPLDGETVEGTHGFCVHFDYQAGAKMDKEAQESIRYFFDGRNITGQVYDLVELEYPLQVAEPCYKQNKVLRSGWHTVKITYEDISGQSLEYKWRFQVVNEE